MSLSMFIGIAVLIVLWHACTIIQRTILEMTMRAAADFYKMNPAAKAVKDDAEKLESERIGYKAKSKAIGFQSTEVKARGENKSYSEEGV